jgi:acyl-CoA thioester hydrolase
MKSPSSESSSNKNRKVSGKQIFIETEERVRYSETDRMGIAHNKHYFEWFEIGRTEYCRRKNIPYEKIEAQGYFLVVVEAQCRYKKALRYDDKFIIQSTLKDATPKKVVFQYKLLSKKEKTLIASGYTIHIVTNAKAEVCSLPASILDKIKN